MFFCFPRDLILAMLTFATSFYYIYYGLAKLFTFPDYEMYLEYEKNYNAFGKAMPLLGAFGIEISGDLYRSTAGYLEILAAFTMLFIPGRAKVWSNWVLTGLTAGAKFHHRWIGHEFNHMAPSYFMLFVMLFRQWIQYLVDHHERCLEELTQKLETAMLGFSPTAKSRIDYDIDTSLPEPKIIETESTLVPGYTHREFADEEQERLFRARLKRRNRRH